MRAADKTPLVLAVGLLIGIGVSVVDAAPFYNGMPQTRGRGGAGSGATVNPTGDITPSSVVTPFVDAGVVLANQGRFVFVDAGTGIVGGCEFAGNTGRCATFLTASLDAGNVLVTGGLAITGAVGLSLGSASNSMNVKCFSAGGVSGDCMVMGASGNFVGAMDLQGRAAAAGAETALVLGNSSALNANQGLVQFRNGAYFAGTKVLEVMSNGMVWTANADGGSAGNVTVNQPAGYVAIANGAASMTLTNSLITTSTGLSLTLATNDTTCLGLYFTRASGSATIGCTNSANCSTAAGCNVFFKVTDLR